MERSNSISEEVAHAPASRRGLFFAALALTISVFPLIWMGGLVTSHQAGLSVPDWPNSYGYNMWLFPPSRWIGGIFYEHTHRLLGTLSGFLAITLMLMAWGPAASGKGRRGWRLATITLATIAVWDIAFTIAATRFHWFKPELTKLLPHFCVGLGSLAAVAAIAWRCRQRDSRRWARWLTVAAFLAVCVQGGLGGYRVRLAELNLAIIHGCFAEAFFALAAFTTLTMSTWWAAARADESSARRTASKLAGITVIVIFCQLIAGALMRHNGAGLAIPGVLVYGHFLPPTDPAALDAINAARAWDQELPPIRSLTQIWMHFSHRLGATFVTIAVLSTAAYVFQKFGAARAAGRVAVILLALLVTQVTLGVLTVYLHKKADIASAHVAIGALTLMTATLLTAMLARQTTWRGRVNSERTVPQLATIGSDER